MLGGELNARRRERRLVRQQRLQLNARRRGRRERRLVRQQRLQRIAGRRGGEGGRRLQLIARRRGRNLVKQQGNKCDGLQMAELCSRKISRVWFQTTRPELIM